MCRFFFPASEFEVNGKTYRNLEAQVQKNKELSEQNEKDIIIIKKDVSTLQKNVYDIQDDISGLKQKDVSQDALIDRLFNGDNVEYVDNFPDGQQIGNLRFKKSDGSYSTKNIFIHAPEAGGGGGGSSDETRCFGSGLQVDSVPRDGTRSNFNLTFPAKFKVRRSYIKFDYSGTLMAPSTPNVNFKISLYGIDLASWDVPYMFNSSAISFSVYGFTDFIYYKNYFYNSNSEIGTYDVEHCNAMTYLFLSDANSTKNLGAYFNYNTVDPAQISYLIFSSKVDDNGITLGALNVTQNVYFEGDIT